MKKLLTAICISLCLIMFSVDTRAQNQGASCSSNLDCQGALICLEGANVCDIGDPCSSDANCSAEISRGGSISCQDFGSFGFTCIQMQSFVAPVYVPQPVYVPEPVAPPEPNSPASGLKFPDVFLFEGSETTNLPDLKEAAAKAYTNLTIDNKAVGKVVFTGEINLNNSELVEKLKNLNNYLIVTKGSIELKSDEIKELNIPAKITFKGLNLVNNEFSILKNDVIPEEGQVSELSYDTSTKHLNFSVKGFSKYVVDVVFKLNENDIEVTEEEYTLTGVLGDLDAKVKITLNDVMLTEQTVPENGKFKQTMSLKPGSNLILVETDSELVKQKQIKIEVDYNKPFAEILKKNIVPIALGLGIVVVLIIGGTFGGYKMWKKRKLNQKISNVAKEVV